MFKGVATLEYHNSWVLAICDNGILEYYRWWVWRVKGIWLMRPKNGAHISIIRGSEERKPRDFLFEHARKDLEIEFNYSNLMEFHEDGYVWVPVSGIELGNIREECGLPRMPIMPFHMTVGKI